MTARAAGGPLGAGYEDLLDDDDDCDTGVTRARFLESKRAIEATREKKLAPLKERIEQVAPAPQPVLPKP